MTPSGPAERDGTPAELARVLREHRGRLVARLARSFGLAHLARAEDAVQTAALRALAGRRHARQRGGGAHRRRGRRALLPPAAAPVERFRGELDDDELALLFAACHPALPAAAQVALALRAVRGFDLSVIADGLLTNEIALAQRLARARTALRDECLDLPAGPTWRRAATRC